MIFLNDVINFGRHTLAINWICDDLLFGYHYQTSPKRCVIADMRSGTLMRPGRHGLHADRGNQGEWLMCDIGTWWDKYYSHTNAFADGNTYYNSIEGIYLEGDRRGTLYKEWSSLSTEQRQEVFDYSFGTAQGKDFTPSQRKDLSEVRSNYALVNVGDWCPHSARSRRLSDALSLVTDWKLKPDEIVKILKSHQYSIKVDEDTFRDTIHKYPLGSVFHGCAFTKISGDKCSLEEWLRWVDNVTDYSIFDF